MQYRLCERRHSAAAPRRDLYFCACSERCVIWFRFSVQGHLVLASCGSGTAYSVNRQWFSVRCQASTAMCAGSCGSSALYAVMLGLRLLRCHSGAFPRSPSCFGEARCGFMRGQCCLCHYSAAERVTVICSGGAACAVVLQGRGLQRHAGSVPRAS